jgi:uncharacterized protein
VNVSEALGATGESVGARHVRWRRVALFVALVWLAGHGLLYGFKVAGFGADDSSWLLVAQVSALVPALVAMGLTRWAWREPLRSSLGLRFPRGRWLVVCMTVPWALCLLALGLALLVPGVRWDGSLQPAVDARMLAPGQLDLLRSLAERANLAPVLLLVPFGLVASMTLSFATNCGEEIGWRGLVHTELRPLGFWGNAMTTGLLWFTWHLPVLAKGWFFPQHPLLGAPLLGAHCLLASVAYALVRDRTDSSLAVALFEGTTEATLLLAVAPVAGGSDLTVGVASVTWLAAEVVVVVGLLLYDRMSHGTAIAAR